jgi:hypothetical protein
MSPSHSIGRMSGGNVGNVHQIIFKPVTVENVAARAFHIDAARLARFPFVRQ